MIDRRDRRALHDIARVEIEARRAMFALLADGRGKVSKAALPFVVRQQVSVDADFEWRGVQIKTEHTETKARDCSYASRG